MYFFITYVWRTYSKDRFEIVNDVIDRSPLEELDSWKNKFKEEMKLLFYKEISKEEFEKFEGHFS